jgi:hypothetical protein
MPIANTLRRGNGTGRIAAEQGRYDMQTLLLAIGAIAAAVGVFTIGFGFEIYDFSFGNTLIIAGTISLIGGIMTVGIAVAIRELTRVADAVVTRSPSRGVTQGDSADAVGSGTNPRRNSSSRAMVPAKSQPETSGRDSRATEPRLTTMRSAADLDEPVAPRARQNVYPLVRPASGSVSIDEPDNVASFAQTPVRAGSPSRADFGSGSKLSDTRPIQSKAGAQITGMQATLVEAPRGIATEPFDRTRAHSFDSVWPADGKHAQFVNEAVARELRPESDTAMTDPAEGSAPTSDRAEPRTSSEPHPASILKSGVIDGMAYTLYIDGSIEAQLSETRVRFSSIEALRKHLENVAGS